MAFLLIILVLLKHHFRELNITGAHQLDKRPSLEEVSKTFRGATILAKGGALVLTVILIGLWPACMMVIGVMNLQQFRHWVRTN